MVPPHDLCCSYIYLNYPGIWGPLFSRARGSRPARPLGPALVLYFMSLENIKKIIVLQYQIISPRLVLFD
jgi:hypothetical protein